METIKDYAGYNKAMSKTLLDKIWWLDKIPTTIDTIIDFGCADGAMFEFINKIFPNRFHFVGVDNNEEMLKQALYKANKNGYRVQLYTALENIPYNTMKNAVLVFNSVIHEILSYTTYWDTCSLFEQIGKCGVKYIAIRDMYEHDNPAFPHCLPDEEIEKWQESCQCTPHNSRENALIEYMLKAEYTTNWDREVRERYLWNWANWFYCLRNYEVVHEEDFSLAYHRRIWRKKYRIPLADLRKLRTHKKMLLKLR